MNKQDLVYATKNALKGEAVTLKTVAATIDAFCDVAAAELLGGGEVPLPGIGKFKVKVCQARKGRDPRTGKTIDIPEHRKVVFSASQNLKTSLKP